jgi:TRAP transporter TAXI family solute receptor
MGTAPIGGAFQVVGGAIAEVLNDHKGDNNWKVQAKGTKGSQENIRSLDAGKLKLALSNSAITYFAVRGESGWEKKFDSRAIATLAPNIAMFITKSDSGIKSITDLKGKTVVIGPAGAGFEMFVTPILKEHGVSIKDIDARNAVQSEAVDMLGDGTADAAFLGGAVPTASITRACTTFDIRFIPFDPKVRTELVESGKYPFFNFATIPAAKYTDLKEDFLGLDVGSMQLITAASVDDDLVYSVTKIMWENRKAIAEKHPAGRAINEKNVVRNTGTEFHPGAIKFYKEAGLWPGEEGDKADSDKTDADKKDTDDTKETGTKDADNTEAKDDSKTDETK